MSNDLEKGEKIIAAIIAAVIAGLIAAITTIFGIGYEDSDTVPIQHIEITK